MEIKYGNKAQKDTLNITNIVVLDSIKKAIAAVKEAKTLREIPNLKKIKGYKNCFRIKAGTYRIGIYIENNIVEFSRILPRKDIYKYFP